MRAVLVTGASGGIGAAIAHAFAEAGDRVAVHYSSRRTAAERVVAGLPGEGHVAIGADIADPEQARRLVDGAAEALGGLDVLVDDAEAWSGRTPSSTCRTRSGIGHGSSSCR